MRGVEMTIDELKAQALQLPPSDRAKLASRLLESLEDLSESEIEELWIEEALRRDADLDSSSALSASATEVFAAARAGLR
jgi:hypothetical protein